MFQDNLTSRQTAKELNISKTSVLKVWKKYKLKKERLPQSIVDDIIKNYNSYTVVELAQRNNVVPQTVRNVLEKKDLKYNTEKEKRDKRNIEIAEDFDEGMSVKDISQKYKLSEAQIRNILKKYNPEKYILKSNLKKGKRVSEEEKQYIINNYYNKKAIDISKELNIPKGTITKIWFDNVKDKKIPMQYICTNQNYFEDINAPEKAYWLGWIMSDGCIYKRKGHSGLLSIALHKDDKYILEELKSVLECDNPINILNNTASITVVSEKMFNDLKNLGVSENKTWKNAIYLEKIHEKYYMDYVFGFFDGDGSVFGKETPSSYGCVFCGNAENMKQIQYMLHLNNIKANLKRCDKKKYTCPFFDLRFANIKNIYVFAKLYTSTKYKTLDRKRKKFSNLIDLVERNVTNRSENKFAVQYFKDNFK